MGSDKYKFIGKVSHTGTPNNGGSHYSVIVTLFTVQTTNVLQS